MRRSPWLFSLRIPPLALFEMTSQGADSRLAVSNLRLVRARSWQFAAAFICAILMLGSVMRPVAAAPAPSRAIEVVAVNRQADGAGLVATVSYICDYAYDFNEIRVRLAQSLSGRRLATAQGSLYGVPCTGERTTAHLALSTSGYAARNGSALVSASYLACDGRDCYDKSHTQRVLAVDSVVVTGHRLSTERGTLVLAEPAELVAGGAGASVTLRLRCATATTLYFTVGVTQRQAGGVLAQGFLYKPVQCGPALRSTRVIVAAHDRGLFAGAAFVTLGVDIAGSSVVVFRTVSIGTESLTATSKGRLDAAARPHGSRENGVPTRSSQAPTPTATAGTSSVVVRGATRHARGAGVVVSVRARCTGFDLTHLYVQVRQRLSDGRISFNSDGVLLDNCDGQLHTTRVGVLAADGVPYARGPALVTATLDEADVTTPVAIAADQRPSGRSQGFYDFTVKETGRLVAGGAGLRVAVTGQCGGLFAILRVAQRDGERVITGSESLIACGGVKKTVRMAAFADNVALARRRTFVSLELGYFDDYQSSGASGYAYRTIAVE
jgi:hypothetical protein